MVVGDLHGLNSVQHQPAKVAAMEGLWHDAEGAPLLLFAWPDDEARENRYELALPKLASLILTHDANGLVEGIESFSDAHPPVRPVFFAFRVMVGAGVLMLLVAIASVLSLRRNRDLPAWLARICVGMTFAGWVATVAGWYVSEIGRQPWLVSGVLRVEQAVGPVGAAPIAILLTTYLALYALLLAAYVSVVFYLAANAAQGNIPRERERLDNPMLAVGAS